MKKITPYNHLKYADIIVQSQESGAYIVIYSWDIYQIIIVSKALLPFIKINCFFLVLRLF